MDSPVACFAHDVVITQSGDVISLAEGARLRKLAFPERDYPDPPPPVTEPLLHFAARIGTENTIRNLVQSGSDVNLMGNDGSTPLHIAAVKGRLDMVRLLLELGANPNLENVSGETAAQAADRAGQSEIAKVLRTCSRS
jgi:ankyrin repeat protein